MVQVKKYKKERLVFEIFLLLAETPMTLRNLTIELYESQFIDPNILEEKECAMIKCPYCKVKLPLSNKQALSFGMARGFTINKAKKLRLIHDCVDNQRRDLAVLKKNSYNKFHLENVSLQTKKVLSNKSLKSKENAIRQNYLSKILFLKNNGKLLVIDYHAIFLEISQRTCKKYMSYFDIIAANQDLCYILFVLPIIKANPKIIDFGFEEIDSFDKYYNFIISFLANQNMDTLRSVIATRQPLLLSRRTLKSAISQFLAILKNYSDRKNKLYKYT